VTRFFLPRASRGGSTSRNTNVQRARAGSARGSKRTSYSFSLRHCSMRGSDNVECSRFNRSMRPSVLTCHESDSVPRALGFAKKQRRMSVSLPRSLSTTSPALSSAEGARARALALLVPLASSSGEATLGEPPPQALRIDTARKGRARIRN
jgi:hypothetical protein